MSASTNVRPAPDRELVTIARYAAGPAPQREEAYEAARLCLMDALGCAFQAAGDPECVKLLGPIVPGTIVPHGARVPGTAFVLDPVKAAFDISALVRWLDFSDTWVAGGHPSDNIGAILAVCDHVSRLRVAAGKPPLVVRDMVSAMIKAYEIHGVLSSSKGIDKPDTGLCGTFFVKIASTAVAAALLGGTEEEIVNAVSNAFVDGASLTIFRKGRHAGSRKNWAAGDTTSRGVALALLALRGEMGYPSALTAKTWGFNEVLFKGRPLQLAAPFGSNVIENIQFKLSYPAQRHTQTAAECAVRLHPEVRDWLPAIESIVIGTHALSIEMVSVTGPLPTPASRDHCLQYVVAIALLHGDITSESYEDAFAADPRIDALRSKMIVEEEPRYTRGYSDPATFSNANAVQVFFADGSSTAKVEVEYPVGDAKRRAEGLPLLKSKFRSALTRVFGAKQQEAIASVIEDRERLQKMPVNAFMDLLAR